MLSEAQAAEISKYGACYETPDYGMGLARKMCAQIELKAQPFRESYLDVSCGRGEMLPYARSLGFKDALGTEVVPGLLNDDVCFALAWDLPFADHTWEVVSLWDVIEHLLPGDDERACKELARVAEKAVLITANNRPSQSMGVELHVNRRPYGEWDALFHEWFPGKVERRPNHGCQSETWRVLL